MYIAIFYPFNTLLFPLGNEFLYVKQFIYVLIHFMSLYLRFSFTSTTFIICMVSKWYQKVVAVQEENSYKMLYPICLISLLNIQSEQRKLHLAGYSHIWCR